MNCPDCGKDQFDEVEVEREFQFGSKNPVTLKATAPVLICKNCPCELHDWRMERAKSLAMSEYLKHKHNGDVDPPDDLRIGHAASSRHKKQLEHAEKCGCFYCLKTFPVTEIEEWIDDGETALCPKCGIDSVVPVGQNIHPEFLKRMQQFWFGAFA